MSRNTPIQWCDDTVNPTMGCDGCELCNATRRSCYAAVLHDRRGGGNVGYAPTFEDVTQFPGRMSEAARWRDQRGAIRPRKPWLSGLPRLIFVSDMSDALSAVVPFTYLEQEIIATVTSGAGRRHCWLWLTKRPQRMVAFAASLAAKGIGWPVNLWAGTSITNQGTTGRVGELLEVGDANTVRFLSVEPQIEPIDLKPWLPRLNWIIQGGESGAEARPFDIRWAYDMKEECGRAGVPYFLKQLGAVVVQDGKRLKLTDGHGGNWSEWPEGLACRQMPRAAFRYTAGNGDAASDMT